MYCIEQVGFEVDDLIVIYVCQVVDQGVCVIIVFGDKDLMQFIGLKVGMIDIMKNKIFGEVEVFEKFGVGLDKVIEVQLLVGDSVDNVLGVLGIGLKMVVLLINEFGDLEMFLVQVEMIKQKKCCENLIEFVDQVWVFKELVILKQDVLVEVFVGDLLVMEMDGFKVVGFLKVMGFFILIKWIVEVIGVELVNVEVVDFQVFGWDVFDYKGCMVECVESIVSVVVVGVIVGDGVDGLMVL